MPSEKFLMPEKVIFNAYTWLLRTMHTFLNMRRMANQRQIPDVSTKRQVQNVLAYGRIRVWQSSAFKKGWHKNVIYEECRFRMAAAPGALPVLVRVYYVPQTDRFGYRRSRCVDDSPNHPWEAG